MRPPAFLKKDWLIGALSVLVMLLAADTPVLERIGLKAYDLGMRFSVERRPHEDVVVVAIDAEAAESLGPQPWRGEQLDKALLALAAAGARVVGYLPELPATDGAALAYIRRLKRLGLGGTAGRILNQAEDELSNQQLAKQIGVAGNVVLAAHADLGGSIALPDYMLPHTLAVAGGEYRSEWLPQGAVIAEGALADFAARLDPVKQPAQVDVRPPAPVLSRQADRVGVEFHNSSADDVFRFAPLVLRQGDHYLPSLVLLLAAGAVDLGNEDIQVRLEQGIQFNGWFIPTDAQLRVMPYFYPADAIQTYALKSVLGNELPSGTFTDKVVLIGATDASHESFMDTPAAERLPPVMVAAGVVSALLNDDLYSSPAWAHWVEFIVLLLVTVYLMFLLPRFDWRLGLGTTVALIAVFINAQFLIFIAQAVWLQLVFPAAVVFVGYLAFAIKQLVISQINAPKLELSDALLKLGRAYHKEGQLDTAMATFRKCAPGEKLYERLCDLAADYERRRQFNKAADTYEYVKELNPSYKEIDNRIQRSKNLENRTILGGARTSSIETLILESGTGEISKPMLGRYQVEREIGRGAMGVVYLGKDPKIGRTVAIKTLALSQEFEGNELEEAKNRFFREAETAGRLSHPHIVTIYDVGEDQDLAYIAMDYLTGDNLQEHTKEGSLLSHKEAFEVIIQVAEAIDYAHAHHVVHRDIKPANIIYNRTNKKVTVTDFGVAHIVGASKTKTGTILGSPSYMSPEQVSGKKIDGRSDIFSIGVTLYQLLTGKVPFTGQPLATLMY
ncbi:MAG: protein kinase, partial [Gammaproteobacteria bacterium]|nr:protein kinase [Gammaproteobacteria bacterium]